MKLIKKTTGMVALFSLSLSLSTPVLAGLSGIYEPGCNACRENPADCDFSKEHAIAVFNITELTNQQVSSIKEGCYNNPFDCGMNEDWAIKTFQIANPQEIKNGCYNNPLDCGMDQDWAKQVFGLTDVNATEVNPNCREKPSDCGLDKDWAIKTFQIPVVNPQDIKTGCYNNPLDCGMNKDWAKQVFGLTDVNNETVNKDCREKPSDCGLDKDWAIKTFGITEEVDPNDTKAVCRDDLIACGVTKEQAKTVFGLTDVNSDNLKQDCRNSPESCGLDKEWAMNTFKITAVNPDDIKQECRGNLQACGITKEQVMDSFGLKEAMFDEHNVLTIPVISASYQGIPLQVTDVTMTMQPGPLLQDGKGYFQFKLEKIFKEVPWEYQDAMGELKVLKTGQGVVTSKLAGGDNNTPSVLDCGEPCIATFPLHTPVTLTATSENSTVTWGGDCATAVGETCDLTIDNHKVVAVAFSPTTATPPSTSAKKFALFVTKIGEGNVSINDQTCGEKCEIAEYSEGDILTLTATPTHSTVNITWDVATCQPHQPTCTITMTQHQAITVTFTTP
ncbi:MAG: hypothetical protein BWK78_01835 [Thiotrichaceae bacterium IS1]|nr:MAG: hypothetical protein BWK78_01835 [Thiotrichaceae bacterium IS1]